MCYIAAMKDNIPIFLNIRDSYLNVCYLLVLIDTSYQILIKNRSNYIAIIQNEA